MQQSYYYYYNFLGYLVTHFYNISNSCSNIEAPQRERAETSIFVENEIVLVPVPLYEVE